MSEKTSTLKETSSSVERDSKDTVVAESEEIVNTDDISKEDMGNVVMRGRLSSFNDASQSETESETECPECDSKLRETNDETVCEDCGYVADESPIDHGPEWRSFTYEDSQKKSRTGLPESVLQHDKGLSTNISWANRDGYGNTLSSKQRRQAQRLRKWNERTRFDTSSDQNLKNALTEIERMSSAMNVPKSTRKMAAQLYRTVTDSTDSDGKPILPGRSIEGVAAACLYISCRQDNITRTFDDIVTVSKISAKRISRTRRYISNELDIPVPVPEPTDYIPAVCSDLNVGSIVERYAKGVLKQAEENGLHSGKDPKGLAASTVYLCVKQLNNGQKITQHDVSNIASISEVTVRNHCDIIQEYCDPEADYIDDEITAKLNFDVENKNPRNKTKTEDTEETEDTKETEDTNNSNINDHSVDETYNVECGEMGIDTTNNTIIIAYDPSAAQWTMMDAVFKYLINTENFSSEIDIPYKANRCKNELIVTHPSETENDFPATWKEIDVSNHGEFNTDTIYYNTKLSKEGKLRCTRDVADKFGYSVSVDGDW